MQTSIEYFDFLWNYIKETYHNSKIKEMLKDKKPQTFNSIIGLFSLEPGKVVRLQTRDYAPCVDVDRAIAIGTTFGTVFICEKMNVKQEVEAIVFRSPPLFSSILSRFLMLDLDLSVKQMDMLVGSLDDGTTRPNIGEMISDVGQEYSMYQAPHPDYSPRD